MSEGNDAYLEEPDEPMDMDDGMDLDEAVQNTTLIENKQLSHTLSLPLQPPKDLLLSSDNSLFTSIPDAKSPVMQRKIDKDSDVVVLDDDEDEPPPVVPTPQVVNSDTETPKDCEIIDLVSKQPISANSKCINYACKSGVDMITAPGFCLTFYRVKSVENKRREVCNDCFELALVHFDKLSTAVINGELLVNVDIPIRNDLVEIDDSDSEDEEDVEVCAYFDASDYIYISKNIEDIIKKTMVHYNITKQERISLEFLKSRGKRMADQFIEVDTLLHDTRKQLDAVHHNLYSTFKVRYEHLPPIDILDINNSYSRGGIRTLVPSTTLQSISKEGDKNNLKGKPVSFIDGNYPATKGNSSVVITDATKEPQMEPIEIPADLPMKGPIEKPSLKIGDLYYAVRFLTMGSWIKVQLTSFVKPGQIVNGTVTSETMYCVSMENKQQSKYPTNRILSGKEIAYAYPSSVQLQVGTRVIAVFKDTNEGDSKKKKEAYYPGVIAEPLLPSNRFRYLIFFDDGYAQYVSYKLVNLIYQASNYVWEDMHIDSRPFIKKYLDKYPERPMVFVRKNEKIRTEYNGKWWVTTVVGIDCSLVQMHFDVSNRVEWIYRGSTRLNPLFKEEQAAATSLIQNRSRAARRLHESGPYVQYTRNDQEPPSVRAVARKSTSVTPVIGKMASAIPFLPPSIEQTVETAAPSSRVVFFSQRKLSNTDTLYTPHVCSVKCLTYLTYDFHKLTGYNPLSKPLLCGWHRLTYKHHGKREINYKAPCGRFIRNMGELHKYLRLTKSSMTVDLFDFDFWVHCLAEYVLESNYIIKKDMSNALEKVAIPIVNYVDSDPTPFDKYSIKRVPKEGVNLNLDPEFLCGCDCEDDCVNKEKCQCWQLTLTGLPFLGRNATEFIGYAYRRLPEPVITGIYECNSRCKCAQSCLNRVVQNPLQLKLQVFKTHLKGWGIRCLNDIPQGAFICIYAGAMLTEQMANEGGKNYGDEYLAELDYIEVVEKMKEDYEEEPVVSDEDERESEKSQVDSSPDDDDDSSDGYKLKKKPLSEDDSDFIPYMFLPKGKENDAYKSRLRKRTEHDKHHHDKDSKSDSADKRGHADDDETVMISDDEDTVHEPSSFNPRHSSKLEESKSPMYTSVREMYGPDECVFVMDAKVSGNIGRFLNHSCAPNVFVQNVFVDTHDLRFPWVAFFALTYIKAGTELTWNYNYDVGSVPGKVLYCHCRALDCRGRLL